MSEGTHGDGEDRHFVHEKGNSVFVYTMPYPSSGSIGGDLHQQGVVVRADVGTLESRPVVDSDTHASWAAEYFDQTRVRLEILEVDTLKRYIPWLR